MRFLGILSCFSVSLYISTLILSDEEFKKTEPEEYQIYAFVDLGLNAVLGLFSLMIIKDEIGEIATQKLGYFLSLQNYVDFPLMLLMLS